MKFTGLFILLLLSNPIANAKGKAKSTQLLEQVQNLNVKKSMCEASPTPPTASEQKPIFTDFLWKISDPKRISPQNDWKWLSVISKFDPLRTSEGSVEYELEIESLKMNGKSKAQNMEAKMGNCYLSMRSKLQLNNTEDEIILGNVATIQVLAPNRNCGCGKSPNCVSYNGLCHEIVAQNSSTPPLTESTITTDFLKPLRDKRADIDRLCH